MSIEKEEKRKEKNEENYDTFCFQNERHPHNSKKKKKHVVSFVGYLNFPMKMREKKKRELWSENRFLKKGRKERKEI